MFNDPRGWSRRYPAPPPAPRSDENGDESDAAAATAAWCDVWWPKGVCLAWSSEPHDPGHLFAFMSSASLSEIRKIISLSEKNE